jgi:hypothetical protein
MRGMNLFFVISSVLVATANFALAQDTVPSCLSKGADVAVNNDQVVEWKTTTKNQFRSRAHIKGNLVRVFPDHSGHHHYEVQIGTHGSDTVEVIYNEDFGSVPEVAAGSVIEACGDYITSNAPAGHFPASPDGAIVHWVHRSPSPNRHDSGFLVIDGALCGQDSQSAGPKHSGSNKKH